MHFFDGEGAIPATVARELYFNGLTEVIHYQVVPYQGSLILDSVLGALGYLFLGDGLLSWHVVALLQILVVAAAGSRVLFRLGGRLPAAAWPVLLACAPFLVKDGMVAMIGGHPGGFAWGLAALAVALEARRSVFWALLAGVLLAIGAWYVRSVIAIAPAVLLACAPGGLRALVGASLGALVLPLLLWGNVLTLEASGLPYAQVGRAELWDAVVAPSGTKGLRQPLPDRLREGSGLSFGGLLFRQPPGEDDLPRVRPHARRSGQLWVAAWIAAVPLVLVGLARRGEGRLELGAAVLFCACWIGAYVSSGLAMEEEVVRLAAGTDPRIPAPVVSSTRYMIPILCAWMFGLPLALAATAGSRALSLLASVPIALAAGVGGIQAIGDWQHDRDDPELYREQEAFSYTSIALPGRLPPIDVHLRALNQVEESRRYHLESIGLLLARGSGPVMGQPDVEAQELRDVQARSEGEITDDDLRTIAFGLGLAMGTETLNQTEPRLGQVFEAILLSADALGGELGDAYLDGAEHTIEAYLLEGPLRGTMCGRSSGRRPASLCGSEPGGEPQPGGAPQAQPDADPETEPGGDDPDGEDEPRP